MSVFRTPYIPLPSLPPFPPPAVWRRAWIRDAALAQLRHLKARDVDLQELAAIYDRIAQLPE